METDPTVESLRDFTVNVIFAERDKVWQAWVTVPAGTDAITAVRGSGFAQAYPAYSLDSAVLGIFGRRCPPDQVLANGDRIEIYRPLAFDPMESRRRRAAHRKAAKQQAAFRPRRVRDESQS